MTTSTIAGTFGAISTGLVVQRNVDPPRCGDAVSGLFIVAFATSLPSIVTLNWHVISLASDTSPPSAVR